MARFVADEEQQVGVLSVRQRRLLIELLPFPTWIPREVFVYQRTIETYAPASVRTDKAVRQWMRLVQRPLFFARG